MRYGTPPSLDDILELAEVALSAIPQELRNMVGGTVMAVEEAPDDEILAEMGMESPWELTGLYRGTPLTQKSVLDVPVEPDTIVLFREPILLEWIETGRGPVPPGPQRADPRDRPPFRPVGRRHRAVGGRRLAVRSTRTGPGRR